MQNKYFTMKALTSNYLYPISEGLEPEKKDLDQISRKIFDYISSHYYQSTPNFVKTAPLDKSRLKINLTTSPPTVDYNGSLVFHSDEPTLTNNGMFQWGNISGGFRCAYRKLLTSLKGAPKVVGGKFDCSNCKLLTSLKGAPKVVGGKFDCSQCESLKTLEGSPEKVGEDFFTYACYKLTSLKGAPKVVGGDFDCNYCKSLTTLKDAPKEVGGTFYCANCGVRFAQSDVKKISNVKNGVINVLF